MSHAEFGEYDFWINTGPGCNFNLTLTTKNEASSSTSGMNGIVQLIHIQW